MTPLYITCFNHKSLLDIVAVYKKGKKEILNSDNIRFVLKDDSVLYSHNKNTPQQSELNVLCLPEKPLFDNTSPMYHGVCATSGLPMKDRPEFTGGLETILSGIELSDTLRIRSYNYYKMDMSSSEVQQAIVQLTQNIACFSLK